MFVTKLLGNGSTDSNDILCEYRVGLKIEYEKNVYFSYQMLREVNHYFF